MAGNDRKRLDSWKDIAQYVGRDLSTVRRWEKERGLPVHRVPGGGRQAVFGYAEEIDAWLVGQPAAGAEEVAARTRSRPLAIALASGLFVVLGIVSLLAWRAAGRTGASEVHFQGNRLVAQDVQGRTLWVHEFPAAVDMPPGQFPLRLHVADLEADGRPEVVAGLRFVDGEQEEVECFGENGTLLWRYRPTQTFDFGGRTFDGPWRISNILITENGNSRAIWVAFTHYTWWPSFIVRLDATGKADLRFVSAGWVTELAPFRAGPRTYVLAGGLNNEYDAGMLAVLDATTGPSARSPQSEGSAYWCPQCPRDLPFRFYVFPRSELNRFTGSSANLVRFIRSFPDKFEVRTEEVPEGSTNAFGIYEFSSDFEVKGASMTDLYWDLHRRLEQEGKISHRTEACRRRSLRDAVRVWKPEEGTHERARR